MDPLSKIQWLSTIYIVIDFMKFTIQFNKTYENFNNEIK